MRIKDWSECWEDQTKSRKAIDKTKICSFGIQALDDAFIGILRNDLVVIGADSGIGKSDICLNIALSNAAKGRRVALFFIEGGSEEAITRIKWKAIKDLYYANPDNTAELDYRQWCMGMLESPAMDVLEAQAQELLNKKIGNNLDIYDFDSSFTIGHLTQALGYYAAKRKVDAGGGFMVDDHYYDVDLVIIDHLQYFTLMAAGSENQEMTQILMQVKDLTQHSRIPVVLVSHLRKKEKDRGLPGQDDFHGTSNICKIASIAITVTNHPTKDNYRDQLFPTFFRVVKSRTGIRSTYAILKNYNFKLGEYDKPYALYALKGDKPLSNPIPAHLQPQWARGKANSTKIEEIDWENL